MYKNSMAELQLGKRFVNLRFPPILTTGGPFIDYVTSASRKAIGACDKRGKDPIEHFHVLFDLRESFGGASVHMVSMGFRPYKALTPTSTWIVLRSF